MLSRLVITFHPGSKRLLISWLQSPSAVILEPPKIKPKDRAERAARFAKTKEEVEAAKAAALLAKQAEMEVKRETSTKERRYFISC